MVDKYRHLDEQMATISGKAGRLPEEEGFLPVKVLINPGDSAVVLRLEENDLVDGDEPVAKFFTGNTFIKLMSTGTFHGGGDKFTTSTVFGKILERTLVNRAQDDPKLKSFLIENGYSFEEPKE